MTQQLFSDIQRHEKEIRRLRGRLDRISAGGSIIGLPSNSIPAPSAEGQIIEANSTPVWARYAFLWLKPAAIQNITAAGTIITSTNSITIITADNDYTLSSAPTIADGVNGQILVIVNADSANLITLQDQGTLANSNLRLAANTVVLGPRDSITLIYSSAIGDWIQIGYMDVL